MHRAVVGRDRDELAFPSQRLIEATLRGDVDCVAESLRSGSKLLDVNHIGTVSLRVRCTENVLREEEADEVEIGYRESAGDVNQELIWGFATTVAAREGHCDLLDMLLKAGVSRSACEDAFAGGLSLWF